LRALSRVIRSRSLRRAIPVGFAALTIAGAASACNPNSPSEYDLYRLRMCESGGNYSIDLGTGFSGAYQFADSTWTGMGYGGRASQAPAWVQDEAVRQLWRQMGWKPWPGCSIKLGLR
jgi:resuscitation-promoting factor RpfA